MRVIIDTNVLVSAVLRDRDPELVVQFIVDNPEFEWVVSHDILTEYKTVLSRPNFCVNAQRSQMGSMNLVMSFECRFPVKAWK
ncbi:MAG: putative toxin-antitoxin system toxin component, PIN family [Thainema sp.]